MSCICIVGMVDGHGYDGQLKYTFCDACRLYHSILSILKPVFCQLRPIRCTYESIRCLDLKIWRFLWTMTTMTTTTTTTTRPITSPLVHACGVIILYAMELWCSPSVAITDGMLNLSITLTLVVADGSVCWVVVVSNVLAIIVVVGAEPLIQQ